MNLRDVRARAVTKLSRLCEAIDFGEDTETALRLFRLLSESWDRQGDFEWQSDVTDDHSPCEFSLAIDGDQRELRFLMEVQGHPMTLQSGWDAGLAAFERLHEEIGIPLARLRLVEDLFAPAAPQARFALWHAVCLRRGQAPDVKVYLNPQAWGPDKAGALLQQAMERLGLANAWHFLSTQVLTPRDRFAYFSLDLSEHPSARVKIYLAQPQLTAEYAERLLATNSDYAPGVARAFCQTILGGEGPFERRPGGTCFAFVEGSDGRPYTTTLYLPPAAYVDNDQQTADRIYPHLEPEHRATLRAALEAVAGRPLDAGVGLIQWVSLKRRNGQNRITTYISPELLSVMPPRPSPL